MFYDKEHIWYNHASAFLFKLQNLYPLGMKSNRSYYITPLIELQLWKVDLNVNHELSLKKSHISRKVNFQNGFLKFYYFLWIWHCSKNKGLIKKKIRTPEWNDTFFHLSAEEDIIIQMPQTGTECHSHPQDRSYQLHRWQDAQTIDSAANMHSHIIPGTCSLPNRQKPRKMILELQCDFCLQEEISPRNLYKFHSN